MKSEQNRLATSTTVPAADCWLRVSIHGLFIGAFSPSGNFLEIGALNPSPDSHKLTLQLWDRDKGVMLVDYGKLSPISPTTPPINLGVPGGQNIQACGPGQGSEGRFDLSLIADFETELYHGKCRKKKDTLTPRLRVFNGMTYTAIRSTLLEKSIDRGLHQTWRSIAMLTAIDVTTAKDTEAILEIDGTPHTISRTDGNQNLVFRNDCSGADCKQVPTGGDRSDFNFLFYAFDPPAGDNHKIDIFIHTSFDRNKDLIRLGGERLGIDPTTAGQEKYLAGVGEIFSPNLRPPHSFTGFDPCGMGFFGDSNGLDDNS